MDGDLIQTLERMHKNGIFKNFIQRIRFPYFKNMREDAKIHFGFPVVAFVGQNGCGKSSVLQALYGAPDDRSIRDFWFSTEVDPIEEVNENGKRHSFVYSFGDSGDEAPLEVLMTRARRENDPDYWEPSKPLKKYGLNQKTRRSPVSKPVKYLDFRGELSAFDKYFYFREPKPYHKAKTKQDFIRNKSKQLENLLSGRRTSNKAPNGKHQNDELIVLPDDVLREVSEILGRHYTGARILRHKLYEDWGVSARLETASKRYTEAFAGSGEMAVIRLVTDIVSAPQKSLILLDEPEVSLHPGAQKRMLRFLLRQAKTKHHQIVLSTHSPAIVEELPPSAIKLFHEDAVSQKFDVLEDVHPGQAFYHLGSTPKGRKEIVVEDILAKKVLDGVISTLGESFQAQISVTFRQGGAETIISKYIPGFSQEEPCNKYVVLDGDKQSGKLQIGALPADEQDSTKLKNYIKKNIGCNVDLYPPGGDSTCKESAHVELIKAFSEFWDNRVFFLTSDIPEKIIWDDELCKNELQSISDDLGGKLSEILNIGCCKKRLRELTLAIYCDMEHYDSVSAKFLRKWLSVKNGEYATICEMIKQICSGEFEKSE